MNLNFARLACTHPSLLKVTCTRSGLEHERLPLGGGGGGGHSPPGCLENMESIRGAPLSSPLPSPGWGPYSSSSSVLLHLDIEELQDTDLNRLEYLTLETFCYLVEIFEPKFKFSEFYGGRLHYYSREKLYLSTFLCVFLWARDWGQLLVWALSW